MSNSSSKLTLGAVLGTAMFLLAQMLNAQTNAVPVVDTATGDPNIVTAMWQVVFRNPASLIVLPFLCVFAWLIDDTPYINSRYVTHLTTVLGGLIYWLFATPSSVPKTFPYPFVVLVVNGIFCGFAAGIGHRFFIAHAILFFRSKFGDVVPATALKPVDPTDTSVLFKKES